MVKLIRNLSFAQQPMVIARFLLLLFISSASIPLFAHVAPESQAAEPRNFPNPFIRTLKFIPLALWYEIACRCSRADTIYSTEEQTYRIWREIVHHARPVLNNLPPGCNAVILNAQPFVYSHDRLTSIASAGGFEGTIFLLDIKGGEGGGGCIPGEILLDAQKQLSDPEYDFIVAHETGHIRSFDHRIFNPYLYKGIFFSLFGMMFLFDAHFLSAGILKQTPPIHSLEMKILPYLLATFLCFQLFARANELRCDYEALELLQTSRGAELYWNRAAWWHRILQSLLTLSSTHPSDAARLYMAQQYRKKHHQN